MSKYTLEDFINLPETIKVVRKEKGLSQKRLGDKVGVTDKAISAYEKGYIKPSIEVFFLILNACNFSLEIKEDIYKTPKKLTIPLS